MSLVCDYSKLAHHIYNHILVCLICQVWYWSHASVGAARVWAAPTNDDSREQKQSLETKQSWYLFGAALCFAYIWLPRGPQDGGPQGQSSTACQVLSSINNGIKRLFYRLEGTLRNLQPHFEIKLGWRCAERKLKQNANPFHRNCISCWGFYLLLACECGRCFPSRSHLLTNEPVYLRKVSNRWSFVAPDQKIVFSIWQKLLASYHILLYLWYLFDFYIVFYVCFTQRTKLLEPGGISCKLPIYLASGNFQPCLNQKFT